MDTADSLLLRTFGGLELRGADFRRGKPLLLLAYLALEGERDRRHVAELFWPQAADHMKSLTVALAQLRKAAPGILESGPLRIGTTVASDAVQFLERLAAGTAAAGLELYRGSFLDGVRVRSGELELEEWIYHTREALAARARAALLHLAEDAAARSDFEAAKRQAETAVALPGAPPLDPGDLPRFHTLLLAAGSPLAGEVRAEADGLGVSLLVTAAEARERLQAGRTAQRFSLRTPRRGTGFVGREPERAEVATLLARPDGRLVTLVGPGGVGKTRLALQIARDLERSGGYRGGVVFVPLDALPSAADFAPSLAAALDLEPGAADALPGIEERIGSSEMLIVLDNFEQIVERAADLSRLLRRCSGLRLLVTSRERLHIEEEQLFPVSGLAYPRKPVDLAEAEGYDAIALFVQRARRARPDFRLDREALAAVIDICELVEGMPLGLELAAASVRVLACREIADEIARGLDLLVTPLRDVPERHRSLHATFEYSWRQLNDRERALLAESSVFRDGFTRSAASAVTGATIPLLASLVDKSLLRRDERERYAFHPLLRQFAREKLAERGDADAVVERHGRHFFALLHPRESDLQGEAFRQALRAIDSDWENVRAMFAWSATSGSAEILERCVDAVELCFERRGQFGEGLDYLAEVERAALRLGDSERLLGRVRVEQAWYHYRIGTLEQATALAEAGIAALSRADDHWESKGHNTLGCVALLEGDLAVAEKHIRRALAVAIRHGDELSRIALQSNLSTVLWRLGRLDEAEELLQSSLAASRRIGKPHRTVFALRGLANVRYALGRFAEADTLLAEALDITDQIGDLLMAPVLHLRRSEIALAAGGLQAAALHAVEARATAAATLRGDVERGALLQSAKIDLAAGRIEAARLGCLEVLRRVREAGDRQQLRATLQLAAEVHARSGDPARAAELLAFALERTGTPVDEAPELRARLERLRSDLDDAEAAAAIERGAGAPEDLVLAWALLPAERR